MKVTMCFTLLFALVCGIASGANDMSKVTPVEKGKASKQAEEVQFASYKQFCDDTNASKKKSIAEAEEMMKSLQVEIQKNAADAARLAKEITGLEEDVAVWTGDISSATRVREIEKADYDAMHKDYSESIDALMRAIQVLKKQAGATPQALVQISSSLKNLSLIPDEAKRAIDTYMMQDPEEGLEVSSPEANAYEFQSQQVVNMLQKLLDKFIDERTTLEKEEMDALHAFELLMHLKQEIEVATEDIA